MKEKIKELLEKHKDVLTRKEIKILELLMEGSSTIQIAKDLRISRKGVNNTITSMRGRGFDIPDLNDIKDRRRKENKPMLKYLKEEKSLESGKSGISGSKYILLITDDVRIVRELITNIK